MYLPHRTSLRGHSSVSTGQQECITPKRKQSTKRNMNTMEKGRTSLKHSSPRGSSSTPPGATHRLGGILTTPYETQTVATGDPCSSEGSGESGLSQQETSAEEKSWCTITELEVRTG